MNIWTVTLIVFILNLPFGYWKASVGRFSLQWFLSIHLPIPLIVALRLTSGLGWQLYTYPILVGAFFIGHFIGTKLIADSELTTFLGKLLMYNPIIDKSWIAHQLIEKYCALRISYKNGVIPKVIKSIRF